MNSLAEFFRTLGAARLAAMGTVAAITIGFFIYISMRISSPHMVLLYSGLDLSDSSKIVQKLEALAVPYKLTGDGSTIMVPDDQVLRLRVSVAEEGLAGGGSLGYEIFDRTDSLGTTSFVQNINHVRALEGELARTINAINNVTNTRVHLVLPQRRLFSNENREATASIFVKTRGGRLMHNQIMAIQNLVAAAIPNLQPERISIVDQKGALLARGASEDTVSQLASSLEEKKISIENRLRGQIEALLEKTVGLGKVRAEVNAELDLNQVTSNSEIYDPEGQVILSSQTRETINNNIENDDVEQISIANNLPDATEGGEGTPAIKSQSTDSSTEETLNYKISKTIRTQIHEAGTVKRIAVAVLIDGTYLIGDVPEVAEGETPLPAPRTYQPRSQEELDKLTKLVKSTVGFDEERGDSINVINMQFADVDFGEETIEDGLFNFKNIDVRWMIEMGVLSLGMILLLLMVVRPLIRYMTTAPGGMMPQAALAGAEGQQALGNYTAEQAALAGPAASAAPQEVVIPRNAQGEKLTSKEIVASQGLESAIDVAAVEGKIQATALKKVGELVERHPEESAAVIRSWLYG